MNHYTGWLLLIADAVISHRLRVTRERVVDVASVVVTATVMVTEYAVRRLGGEWER